MSAAENGARISHLGAHGSNQLSGGSVKISTIERNENIVA